jgi:hypothetical protein
MIERDSISQKPVQKIVAQLKDDVNPKLKIDCLRILEAMITMMNTGHDAEEEDHKLKLVVNEEEAREAREAVQNKLGSLKVLEEAIELFGENDKRMSYYTLKLACALLAGGNEELQQSMLGYFQSHSDSKFFSDVRDRLIESASELKSRRRQNLMNVKRSTMNLDSSQE